MNLLKTNYSCCLDLPWLGFRWNLGRDWEHVCYGLHLYLRGGKNIRSWRLSFFWNDKYSGDSRVEYARAVDDKRECWALQAPVKRIY